MEGGRSSGRRPDAVGVSEDGSDQHLCPLLVYDPEYPGIATDDDAAGNDERDHEECRFGGVATFVFQDGAGPKFAVHTEYTCKKAHSGGYFFVAPDQYIVLIADLLTVGLIYLLTELVRIK
jgi:hypothetical protein